MRTLPNYSPPHIERVRELLLRLLAGQLLIPRFQRHFVWKDEQRLELFRSIVRGLPIGSILTWTTKTHHLACFETIGGLRVAPPSQEQPKTYLLDGHQRMASLLATLGPGLVGEEGLVEQGEAEALEIKRGICFDLGSDDGIELAPRSGKLPPGWIDFAILLDPSRFFAAQRRLSEASLNKLARRMEYLATIIKDYQIPVVPLVSEDLDQVTDAFRLINSAGTRMSLFHMVNALTWSPDFDLSNRSADFQASLPAGWRDLDEDVLLRMCKLILDLDLFENEAKRVAEAFKAGAQSAVLEKAQKALTRALKFLDSSLKIQHSQILPYTHQVVLVAEALRLEPTDEPSADLSKALWTWFWVTTYTEHFGGASAGRMSRVVKQIRRIRNKEAVDIAEELAAGPVEPASSFSLNTARSRAAVWRLAEMKYRSSANEGYNPFELLAKDARGSLLRLSQTPRKGREGIEHWLLLPAEEHHTFQARLAAGSLAEQDLAAHGIDAAASAAFAAGDLDEFFRRRRRVLLEDEARFVRQLGLEYSLPPE